MSLVSQAIIPLQQTFYNTESNQITPWENVPINNLDLKAISCFCSLGFMLDDDTFSNKIKVLKPATDFHLNENQEIIQEKNNWNWHHSPVDKSFVDFLDEFTEILKNIINNSTKDKRILLPISGGLDSRSLLASTLEKDELTLASYEFENGINETQYGIEIANKFKIPIYAQKIPSGYIWHSLDKISQLNNCFTDFLHPRQFAVLNSWKGLGDVILLGHWGDVLFDKQTDSKNITYDEQIIQLKENILKPGGIELAHDLWKHWSIEDSFETYITDRLDQLYRNIDIAHPSARMRAFKSLYWAPRWTSINLSIFNKAGELVLPYYSNEMCKFICTVPERYLEGRKIQIEYIKKNCPEVARIPWQKYYPLNLYQYQRFNQPHYYLVRAARKVKRILQQQLSKTPELITRNWELQFLGKENSIKLRKNLLERSNINKFIPQTIIKKYLDKFQLDPIKYAHPVSMLLTLTVFADRHYSE